MRRRTLCEFDDLGVLNKCNLLAGKPKRAQTTRKGKHNRLRRDENREIRKEKVFLFHLFWFSWLTSWALFARGTVARLKITISNSKSNFTWKQQTKVASYNDSYRYSVLTEGNLFFISWFAWYVRRYVGLCCSMFLLAGFGNFVFSNSYARNKIKYTHISCMQFNCINRDKNIT